MRGFWERNKAPLPHCGRGRGPSRSDGRVRAFLAALPSPAFALRAQAPPPAVRERGYLRHAFAFLIACSLFLLWTATPARAVRPDEMLADPALEMRARRVGEELRCLVCRNQSIEDSDADLAHDLRVLVRDRINAGDTDRQTIDYIHARYGDFVLLRPPFQADTLLLWGGPLLVLLIGGFTAWRFCRRRAELPAPAPLSADERRRLDTLLEQGNES